MTQDDEPDNQATTSAQFRKQLDKFVGEIYQGYGIAEICNAEGVGVSYENTGHECQIWHHEWRKPRVMPDLARVTRIFIHQQLRSCVFTL